VVDKANVQVELPHWLPQPVVPDAGIEAAAVIAMSAVVGVHTEKLWLFVVVVCALFAE